MEEFNSDDHYIYYCGQESLTRNDVATIVNKRVWNAVLGCSFKNDRMISVHFQGKPFNTTVIQVYIVTTNAKEVEVERFYEDLQDLLELMHKKMSFSSRGWNAKVGSQEIPGATGKLGLGVQNEVGQRLTELCQENSLGIENNTSDEITWKWPHGHHVDVEITRWSILKSGWLYSLLSKMEKIYTVSKKKTWIWLWLR